MVFSAASVPKSSLSEGEEHSSFGSACEQPENHGIDALETLGLHGIERRQVQKGEGSCPQ